MYDTRKPFNGLPLLPPKSDIETKAVLKKAITANRALAELKGTGSLIPNQTLLINTLPLQEALASSEIENIVTTQDELFKAAASEKSSVDPRAKEIVRYRTALRKGYDLLAKRPLSVNMMIDICSTLLNKEIDVRKIPGTVLSNPDTGKVRYTPPEGEGVIRDMLTNLEKFVHTNDQFDPLIKMALMHYQFEAIHPFHDGNGRTGRIINILYLVEKELLSLPILYLSRSIIARKNEYYTLLRNVTEKGEWEKWILFMLSVVEETAQWTLGQIKDIAALFEETTDICREELPGVYSRELVELLFTQPYVKISFLETAGIAKRQTASEYLRLLTGSGILKPIKAGREKVFINTKLVTLLMEK